MDAAQRTILADSIKTSTDSDVIAALAVRNDTELARLYNLDDTYVVWRESVPASEYREQIVWTEVESMTDGKARVWMGITDNTTGDYDATKENVRAGLQTAWSGGQTASNLIPISKEYASLFQSLYANGTGTINDPGVRDLTGNVSDTEVSQSLNENP